MEPAKPTTNEEGIKPKSTRELFLDKRDLGLCDVPRSGVV